MRSKHPSVAQSGGQSESQNSYRLTLLTLFVLALFILVPAASAYDGRSGERVVVAKDEVIHDDLFAGGNTVMVDGTVDGDLVAWGQTVIINSKVTGNVIAAGSGVTVNGEVGHWAFVGIKFDVNVEARRRIPGVRRKYGDHPNRATYRHAPGWPQQLQQGRGAAYRGVEPQAG